MRSWVPASLTHQEHQQQQQQQFILTRSRVTKDEKNTHYFRCADSLGSHNKLSASQAQFSPLVSNLFSLRRSFHLFLAQCTKTLTLPNDRVLMCLWLWREAAPPAARSQFFIGFYKQSDYFWNFFGHPRRSATTHSVGKDWFRLRFRTKGGPDGFDLIICLRAARWCIFTWGHVLKQRLMCNYYFNFLLMCFQTILNYPVFW